MKSLLTKISLIAVAAMLLVSCHKYVNKTNDQPIPAGLSKTQVSEAIVEAGNVRGWKMNDNGTGVLTAKLVYKGEEFVMVQIPYSTSNYSIKYVDSQGLDYDATTGAIDKDYNNWITTLNNQIQKQLLIEETK